MSEKKDLKGRKLHTGESQLSNGRYRYRYTDKNGKRHCVYSWRLTRSDKPPKGKRDDLCLRDKEKDILITLAKGNTAKSDLTINDCFDMVMRAKVNLKESTKQTQKISYNANVRRAIGEMKISKCTQSDITAFYASLFEDGKKHGTVKMIHSFLHTAFEKGIELGIVSANITTKAFKEVSAGGKGKTSKKPPHALTKPETALLLDYLSFSGSQWLPLIVFLINTGCRIGEVTALTWNDIDMTKNEISINHGGYYVKQGGKHSFIIDTPKTKNSLRVIPLLAAGKQALIDEKNRQKKQGIKSKTTIKDSNGKKYHDFVFLTAGGKPHVTNNLNTAFQRIVKNANDFELYRSTQENRNPIELRPFSCHDLRHTFCTRLCEVENNPKVVMSIMGHSDLSITMNVYNELQKEHQKKAFENINSNFAFI
ncbi:MAG: site-specific integrase [Eubacteriaceae bacterium]|nr:site-specific integrase [Eubacteriaceae bacterium]